MGKFLYKVTTTRGEYYALAEKIEDVAPLLREKYGDEVLAILPYEEDDFTYGSLVGKNTYYASVEYVVPEEVRPGGHTDTITYLTQADHIGKAIEDLKNEVGPTFKKIYAIERTDTLIVKR